LSKNQRQRLRDIGEARIAIEEALQGKAEEAMAVVSPIQSLGEFAPGRLLLL
jgi:hypothetical protein